MNRFFAPLLIGVIFSIIIWILAPYNNFVLNNAYVSDTYLPTMALFLSLLVVLLLNPLVHRIKGRPLLSGKQVSMILGLMMMASILPSTGLLRSLPYAIAKAPIAVSENPRLAEAFKKMDLPPSLFPAPIGFGADTTVSNYFITELPAGKPIPWGAWVKPLLSWGAFLICSWMMMLGLALIVMPQWRKNERLAFPLLTIIQPILEEPDEGTFFPSLFRNRAFWIASILVFAIHLLSGLRTYTPSVPAIPISWSLTRLFSGDMLRYLPTHIYVNRLYFAFVGIAFFMPNRISFSIWFFVIAYGLYMVIGREYCTPFYPQVVNEHRMGAMLALTVGILWLGRARWMTVIKALFRRIRTNEDVLDRRSGLFFLLGSIGMFFWMLWIGLNPFWAFFFLCFAFMVSLLTTRIVAESGLPFIRIDTAYEISLIKLLPFSWIGAVPLYFCYVMDMLFTTASRMNITTMSAHTLQLDDDMSPRSQSNYTMSLLLLLILGLVVCGSVHLYASYHNSCSLDGMDQPLSSWGVSRMDGGNAALLDWLNGRLNYPVFNLGAHIAFGAALAGCLQWACLTMPLWPLHPIGLLIVHTFCSNEAWFSIFLGWLIKVLILRYGGARLYRSARPVFMGLILGEIFATVFWALVPIVLIALNMPYKSIKVQPY